MVNNLESLRLIDDTAGWVFSHPEDSQHWLPLERESVRSANRGGALDHPGLYEVKVQRTFGRIRGDSRVIYVGVTAGQEDGDTPSLAKRFEGRIGNGSGVEKWLRAQGPGHGIEVRWAVANSRKQAMFWERLRLRWYIETHWEFPPGNANSMGVDTKPLSLEALLNHIEKLRRKSFG